MNLPELPEHIKHEIRSSRRIGNSLIICSILFIGFFYYGFFMGGVPISILFGYMLLFLITLGASRYFLVEEKDYLQKLDTYQYVD